MKAVVVSEPGGPEVLQMTEMAEPSVLADEILVQVIACGVNPVDYKIRKGLVGGPHQYPLILGYDVSGIVKAIGEDVTDVSAGDTVYYFAPINVPLAELEEER